MLITLATSPQSNSKLLMRGLRLYLASFQQVFGLALLFSFIVFIPQLVALMNQLNLLELVRSFHFYNAWFIIVDICAIFVFTAILWRIRCVITNQHESILDDFKIASQKILLILGASIIYLLIAGLVVFFLILLPAQNVITTYSVESVNFALVFLVLYFVFIAYIYYLLFFSLPLILTEDKGIFAALRKSASLVWGNWWRVFSLLIIPPLAYFLLISLIQGVFNISLAIRYTEVPNYQTLLVIVANIVLFALFVPLQGGLLLLQLRDLELRKQV